MKKFKNIETISIHSGLQHESLTRSVVPPIEVSTNFEHSEMGQQQTDYAYTRKENPNRNQLENLLANLEGGEVAASFSSGIAALSAAFQGVEPGSHIILPKEIFFGTRYLMTNFALRWGLEYTYVDMTNYSEVKDAQRENTKLVFIETPSNPTMCITDLEKMCNFAKSIGARTCVDNTFATPLNVNPIQYGADLVMHSTSKYLAGHSDLLSGALISAKDDDVFEKIRLIQIAQGAVPSPRDSWLLSRSIRSFPYRMRGHNENAGKVAEYLNQHPNIEQVFYPGLKTHPGHEIARTQMKGFGGIVSFLYKGGQAETLKAVAKSKLIKRATSLGGIESTWEHRRTSEVKGTTTPENLVRFSVGLEHIDDLIADLEQALG